MSEKREKVDALQKIAAVLVFIELKRVLLLKGPFCVLVAVVFIAGCCCSDDV